MEDNQQYFTINTPPKKPSYLEDCKRIDHEEKNDYGNHRYKRRRRRRIGRQMGAINDQYGDLKVWKAKNKSRSICKYSRCMVEIFLFRVVP